MMAVSVKSGNVCGITTVAVLVFAGFCCQFVRAQTVTVNGQPVYPTYPVDPYYNYNTNYNSYNSGDYNNYPSNPAPAPAPAPTYYGNNPGYNYNYNYNPAPPTTTPPPPPPALPTTPAPWMGGQREIENDEGGFGTYQQPNSAYSSHRLIPTAQRGLSMYGDWNTPVGAGVLGNGMGLLERLAPRYQQYNNYNNYQRQQNSFGGLTPFLTMLAFDAW